MLHRWLLSACLASLLSVAGSPVTSAQPAPEEKKEPDDKKEERKRDRPKRGEKKDDNAAVRPDSPVDQSAALVKALQFR